MDHTFYTADPDLERDLSDYFAHAAPPQVPEHPPNPFASPADNAQFHDAMAAIESDRHCAPWMQDACNIAQSEIAHANRNYWQAGLAPDHLPEDGSTDSRTGITWHVGDADHLAGMLHGYHGDDDCARGTGPVIDAYRDNPEYARWQDGLQAGGDHVAGPYGARPGAQVCYDAVTHERTSSGTFDAQTPPQAWDFIPDYFDSHGDYARHQALDMAPHERFGGDQAYRPYDPPPATSHDTPVAPVESWSFPPDNLGARIADSPHAAAADFMAHDDGGHAAHDSSATTSHDSVSH